MHGPLNPAPWTLILGPSNRAIPLQGLIEACAAAPEPAQGSGPTTSVGNPELLSLDSLADLLETPASPDRAGRLLLDVDGMAWTDVGFVTHFLGRVPHWELWLMGEDDRSRTARQLLGAAQARWCGWPLDLEQLQRLTTPPGADLEPASQMRPASSLVSTRTARAAESARSSSAMQAPTSTRSTRNSPRKLEEDLIKIESILSGDSLAALAMPDPASSLDTLTESDVILTHEELEAFQASMESGSFLEQPTEEPAAPHESPIEPSSAPPKWYKSQVADLADIAQRVDLALNVLREQHQDADLDGELVDALNDPIERLGHDALRLVQFSRTLGYLAAPPSQGKETLRLDTLLQETLTGLADSGPQRARYMFRAEGALEVRSDKGLLIQVLDALLILAGSAAGPGGEVRASAHAVSGEQGQALAELRIAFPAGLLSDVPAAEVLEPYGLRGILPGLGPNALAAASRIVEGQGGDLLYGEGAEPGQALFLLTLPCA